MKAKQARRVLKGLQNGNLYHLQTLRQAAFMVGHPLVISLNGGIDLVYHPKGMKGEFCKASNWGENPKVLRKGCRDLLSNSYDYVRDLDTKEGTLIVDPHAGSSIYTAAHHAARFATSLNAKVCFTFNGIEVIICPRENSQEVYRRWNDESNRRHEEYLNSDEYKQLVADRQKQLEINQEIIDRLVDELPSVVRDEVKTMDWLHEFARIADDTGLDYNVDELDRVFAEAGWVSSAHVLSPDLDRDGAAAQLHRGLLERNKKMFAEYVIGQARHCFSLGMPPHPVCMSFVEKYREMPAEPDPFVCA